MKVTFWTVATDDGCGSADVWTFATEKEARDWSQTLFNAIVPENAGPGKKYIIPDESGINAAPFADSTLKKHTVEVNSKGKVIGGTTPPLVSIPFEDAPEDEREYWECVWKNGR